MLYGVLSGRMGSVSILASRNVTRLHFDFLYFFYPKMEINLVDNTRIFILFCHRDTIVSLTPRKWYYLYSQNIFPCLFGKTTRKIRHNELLLTKFGKNFVILKRCRQRCSLLQIFEPMTEKAEDEVVLFLVSRKTKSSFSALWVWKYFEEIIKQLLNPTFVSPGSLSDLITIWRHNVAAIPKFGNFRTHSALLGICSIILG